MKFEQRVQEHLSALSPGQKKVADYIVKNLDSFSYSTLAKLSKEIHVSETTIIRLSYSLGFESFSQMQAAVRNQLLQYSEIQDSPSNGSSDFYGHIFENNVQAIRDTAAHLSAELLNQVSQLLTDADMILTVGARLSYYPAHWFGTKLYQLRPNVYSVEQFYDPRSDLLQNLTDSSVIFCISMARYAKWTCQYVEIAKKQGAKVILLTDNLSSPLATLADHVLLVNAARDETGSNSQVALYCLLDAILARFLSDNREAVAQRLRSALLYQNFDYYFE